MSEMRAFGPKSADHPSVGNTCEACGEDFKAGDYTTLAVLGPGSDPEEQEKARDGRPYNAIAVEIHWSCGTGLPDPEGVPPMPGAQDV